MPRSSCSGDVMCRLGSSGKCAKTSDRPATVRAMVAQRSSPCRCRDSRGTTCHAARTHPTAGADLAVGNVLISSAGRRVVLVDIFRQALQAAELPGRVMAADACSLAPALETADDGFVVPPCSEPTFIASMLDLCARERVSLLVPTIDTELPPY